MTKKSAKIIEIDNLSQDIFRNEYSELPAWFNLIQPEEKTAFTQIFVDRLVSVLNRLFEAREITTESRAHIRWNNQQVYLSPNNAVLQFGYSSKESGFDLAKTMIFDFATNPDAFTEH